ncbi:SGNH/GDSL hydrolase family protein [Fructobacillus fructosus]|uniref:SGNH/GDSL hydrolase family protein n=1 Tax=Fructobacillus fructosus TaxID=1631 RepID=UPI0024680676|nr:SGNH/GDSL hydrolase family protein [Fructobacillus fructosus]
MRLKMYKSVKSWLIASAAAVALIMTLSTTAAHADQAGNEGQTTQATSNQSASSDQQTTNSVNQSQVADSTNQENKTNEMVKNGQRYQYFVNGVQQKNSWYADAQGQAYYFGADGNAVSGWQTIGQKLFYFGDDDTYTKRVNQDIDWQNVRYHIDQNGVAEKVEGLVDDGADRYWFIEGVKQTNTWATQEDKIFYFGADGKAATGWLKTNGNLYFFGNDHVLATNTDHQYEGVTYHSNQYGVANPKNGILWGFGDSTTVGWNPYNDGSQSYDHYAAKDTDKLFINVSAHSGTLIENDMDWMTDEAINLAQFKNATDIVIGMGVNDVNYGDNRVLNTVMAIFKRNIERLHMANPNARIFVLLPQGNYWNGKTSDTPGNGGYSLNDLRAAERQVAQDMGAVVIDADIVNDANHSTTLPDGVHPTNVVYQEIGQKIADSMTNNQSNNFWTNNNNYGLGNVSGYVNTMSGWRWLQNGRAYTGFQFYTGTYYWFQNGVRSDNAWHEAWGNRYYTGSDGRAVQGWQTIEGKRYYFGDDNTYAVRKNMEVAIDGQKYKTDDQGELKPWAGYIFDGSSQNGGYRWYEDGQLYTGFRYYAGTYYWFIDGVRQNAGWRQAWGYTYYTDNDGRAVQGNQVIDGKVYNFGNDGTFYERPVQGYVWDGSSQNGGYRWYENGQLFTGFRYYTGTYYWFINGVRQNAGWREAWGYKYYTDNDGRAVQGHQTIDGKHYYFGNDGTFYLR